MEPGHKGAGVGLGSGGQPLGQKPPQLQQGWGKQKQKSQTQSRAVSPPQEEDAHEALLAQLSGLIPNSLLEQVRTNLPWPEKPLTERMMQVQNKLDEEKIAVNSWREAVKVVEHTPFLDEDVDMEDNLCQGGKKRRARSPEPLTYEQMELAFLIPWRLWARSLKITWP